MTDIFQPILAGSQLEGAVVLTMEEWLPTYLQEMELQLNRTRGKIPMPRSYSTRNVFTKFPEDQMPIFVVVSPGTAGPPRSEGDGSVRIPWRIAAGIIVSSVDQPTSNELVKIYAAAIRAIFVQQGSLLGFAQKTNFEGESYQEVPIEDADRTIAAAQILTVVEVEKAVNKYGGPTVPPGDPGSQPGSNWPTIQTVIIDIVKKPLYD